MDLLEELLKTVEWVYKGIFSVNILLENKKISLGLPVEK